MSEDEKKAIEHLNKIKSYGMIRGLKADGDIDIVLNLIKKQQNELEKRQWVKIKDNGEIEPLFYISKGKISAKIKEIEDSSFSTEEERDCQCYAIEQLKELMEN